MNNILRQIPEHLLPKCSRRDLLTLIRGEQSIRMQMQEELDRLRAEKKALEEQVLEIEGQYVRVKNRLFGKSSEKSPISDNDESEKYPISNNDENEGKKPDNSDNNDTKKKAKDPTTRLPSERYPNADIIEKELKFDIAPNCKSCGLNLIESDMTEVSEYLTVIPKKHIITRQIRHKYRCKCHGDIQTTPGLPRIKPGSAYSDEMIIDIAASKYCDLIPIERYCAIAARQGFEGLPPNSLIEATHNLAKFVSGAVDRVKQEVLELEVLQADETTHRMLEGDAKTNWYLWGFSGKKSCYFECHDTRSGDVASDLLISSSCQILVSDVFSGYKKAVRIVNKERETRGQKAIEHAYCNAHSRRKFKEASDKFFNATKYYLEQYREIYKLEAESKGKPPDEILEQRRKMTPIFEAIKKKAESEMQSYSSKSSMYTALNYFIKNLRGLTLFINNPEVPIDNNAQERNLRSPVIGRKTWYGTHSRRGAETASKLFTLVESCKLNGVNPRVYLQELVMTLHLQGPAFSPKEYQERQP